MKEEIIELKTEEIKIGQAKEALILMERVIIKFVQGKIDRDTMVINVRGLGETIIHCIEEEQNHENIN